MMDIPHSGQVILYNGEGQQLCGIDKASQVVWVVRGDPQPSPEAVAYLLAHWRETVSATKPSRTARLCCRLERQYELPLQSQLPL